MTKGMPAAGPNLMVAASAAGFSRRLVAEGAASENAVPASSGPGKAQESGFRRGGVPQALRPRWHLPRIPALSRVSAPFILFLASTAASASGPATFGDIESRMIGDRTLDAEQDLARRLAPPGAAIADVSDALVKAGAYYISTTRTGRLKFLYSGRETYVTITVVVEGEVVRSVTVDRQTLGG
jgi:hypothetical protein